MKKDNHKKSVYLKNAIFIALFIISIMHIFILFQFLCDNAAIGLSWSISIAFLIGGFVLWIVKPAENISKKRKKYILRLRIIYTSLGGILFIVNAFVFINKVIVSWLLIITVALVFISICLLLQLANSKNSDVVLYDNINTNNDNNDEIKNDIDSKEVKEFGKNN